MKSKFILFIFFGINAAFGVKDDLGQASVRFEKTPGGGFFASLTPDNYSPYEPKLIPIYKKMVKDYVRDLDHLNHEMTIVGEEDRSVMSYFSQANPLVLFRSCEGCSLSRRLDNRPRCFFEQQLNQFIKIFFPNRSQAFVITSFACGSLLEELKLITDLATAGYNNFRLNLIDKCFKNLQSLSATDQDYARIQKLLYWIKNVLKKNIAIHIYAGVESYLADCAISQANKSDIIIAIDYAYEHFDYLQLVINGLKYNGILGALSNDRNCVFAKKIKNFSSKVLSEKLRLKEKSMCCESRNEKTGMTRESLEALINFFAKGLIDQHIDPIIAQSFKILKHYNEQDFTNKIECILLPKMKPMQQNIDSWLNDNFRNLYWKRCAKNYWPTIFTRAGWKRAFDEISMNWRPVILGLNIFALIGFSYYKIRAPL